MEDALAIVGTLALAVLAVAAVCGIIRYIEKVDAHQNSIDDHKARLATLEEIAVAEKKNGRKK